MRSRLVRLNRLFRVLDSVSRVQDSSMVLGQDKGSILLSRSRCIHISLADIVVEGNPQGCESLKEYQPHVQLLLAVCCGPIRKSFKFRPIVKVNLRVGWFQYRRLRKRSTEDPALWKHWSLCCGMHSSVFQGNKIGASSWKTL